MRHSAFLAIRSGAVALAVLFALWFLLLSAVEPAFGGQASAGELFFYPCTSCHPVVPGAASALPSGFKGHQIQLESHDRLGPKGQVCEVCHEDAAVDPGKLKAIDGSVDVTGDVSRLCYRCHSDKYKEWQARTHGKGQPRCTSSGCHDPHTPAWVYAEPLLPFAGTGIQVRAVSEREPFTPFASPPVAPPVESPAWLVLAATIGAVISVGTVGWLTLGRLKR